MTKLIFACDVSDPDLGLAIIDKTAPHIDIIKVGLESMTAEDANGETLARRFRIKAQECGKDVMWDMKIHDVANTMKGAAHNIIMNGSKLFTLHASAGQDALWAITCVARGFDVIPLAVTVLTDLDEPQCRTIYGGSPPQVVEKFAKRASSYGIKGFVCSGLEAAIIRQAVPEAYIVCPGIRPHWSVEKSEQKRVTTPAQAKKAGADAIVVGRPISKPPLRFTEASAAREIKEELEAG